MESTASYSFERLLTSRANNLLSHQKVVAAMSYNSHSGELLRSTQQQPGFNNVGGKRLILYYPIHIRFLDMKKGRNGRNKKVYEPIYNKFIWGYLFTGTYMALTRGLTGKISMTIVHTIEGKIEDIR